MSANDGRQSRWVHYTAAIWAVGFAAPHIWWALGIPAGFPGGEAIYRLFMGSLWRYLYDVVVIFLSVTAFFVAMAPVRSWGRSIPPWILRTAAWIACGLLTLRGVAGIIVDGTSDLVWWPIFLTGGTLFGRVAWLSYRKNEQNSEKRPLAFEEGNFMWNIQRVPHTLSDGKTPHPGRTSAIFVVHGIGSQGWTETAAQLRAGFEKAFEQIAAWQKRHPDKTGGVTQIPLPPPFVVEGYWADYNDIRATFPEDWKRFNERERKFFGNLWKRHVVSISRTIGWMLRQQLRLLKPGVLREVGPFAWILYWPLQFVSASVLLFAWFRYREAITGFANDLRLYTDPRGVVERAIVQRIDYLVGSGFLRMIGLDWEFRPLPRPRLIQAGGERLSFKRVVWVAHSLGTVISYNVLSALFHKAGHLESTGDDEQKGGVALFRQALCRFVTMGSPLDKVAFLFKGKSLRPWPDDRPRRELLKHGEMLAPASPARGEGAVGKKPPEKEWWVNFYHVLDPVSGSLESPFICGKKFRQPPSNVHIRSGLIPGWAHAAYWKDDATLRFILGRAYGTGYLKDKEYSPWPPAVLSALAAAGYLIWSAILFGSVYFLYKWGPDLLRAVGKAALEWITG